MKRINTVKKNEDFKNAIKKGKYYKDPYFVIYKYNNNLNHYRFGISVSKKLGNAVVRNKIKRQMRNIIDKYKNYYSNKADYIIIIKKGYNIDNFEDIKITFYKLINKMENTKEQK